MVSSNHLGPWAFCFFPPWQAREENVLFKLFSAASSLDAFPPGNPCEHHAGTHKAVILSGALKGGEPWSVGSIHVASNSDSREAQVFEKRKRGIRAFPKEGCF